MDRRRPARFPPPARRRPSPCQAACHAIPCCPGDHAKSSAAARVGRDFCEPGNFIIAPNSGILAFGSNDNTFVPGETTIEPIRRAFVTLLACLLALPASAAAAETARDLAFACTNSGLTRTVEVVAEPGYACRVRYAKSGGTTYPWNARKDAEYCGPKALFLVERLRSWGWQCDSAEDVESVLRAHIERYQRHIRILGHVGKACAFYPAEVQFGNLCGDARDEGAIVYTCEAGGDAWDQHLAVFLELDGEPLILEVGSSRSRQVTSYFIDDRRLLMETRPLDDGAEGAPGVATVRCADVAGAGWALRED